MSGVQDVHGETSQGRRRRWDAGMPKSKAYNNPLPSREDEHRYTKKCRELKLKIKEVEAENAQTQLAILKAQRNIHRLRIERSVLYEALASIASQVAHVNGSGDDPDGVDTNGRDGLPPSLPHPGLSTTSAPVGYASTPTSTTLPSIVEGVADPDRPPHHHHHHHHQTPPSPQHQHRGDTTTTSNATTSSNNASAIPLVPQPNKSSISSHQHDSNPTPSHLSQYDNDPIDPHHHSRVSSEAAYDDDDSVNEDAMED